jgi:hypothetical protein
MGLKNLIRKFLGPRVGSNTDNPIASPETSSGTASNSSKRRPLSPKEKKERALLMEKVYIAREFFLTPGVIRKRSCAGTGEDDQ